MCAVLGVVRPHVSTFKLSLPIFPVDSAVSAGLDRLSGYRVVDAGREVILLVSFHVVYRRWHCVVAIRLRLLGFSKLGDEVKVSFCDQGMFIGRAHIHVDILV